MFVKWKKKHLSITLFYKQSVRDLDLKVMGKGRGSFLLLTFSCTVSTFAFVPDDRQHRKTKSLHMLLVRCTMGDICLIKETKKLTRPPCKVGKCHNDTCTHDDRYNSVVAEETYIFREFCVYEKQQTYPEYVITYDRVNV